MGSEQQLSARTARGRSPGTRAAVLARFWLGIIALFLITVTATLVAIAVVPAVLPTWSATAVGSGSMEPALRRGDVVVLAPAGEEPLAAPAVVLIEQPGDAPPLLHRVVERTPGGEYVTRGDANAVADSSPAAPERILGVGTLLVPFVGYPLVWLAAGNLGAVLAVVLAAAAALWLARYGWEGRYDPWAGLPGAARPPRRAPQQSPRYSARRWRIARLGAGRARHVMLALALVVALGAAGTAQPLSSAAFTAQTDNSANHLASDVLQPVSELAVSTTCTATSAVTFVEHRLSTTNRSVSFQLPQGVRAGDLLVAYVVTSTRPGPEPDGFARVVEPTRVLGARGRGLHTTIDQRVATADDAGKTYSWSTAGTDHGGLAVFRNAQPLRVSDTGANTDDEEDEIYAPSLPGSAGGMLFAMFSNAEDSGFNLRTNGMTGMLLGRSRQVSAFASYRFLTADGQTGTVRATVNDDDHGVIGESIVVRPAIRATHTLTWRGSPSPYATGYEVRRNGEVVPTSLPSTATSWSETIPATSVPPSYDIRTRAGSWRSVPLTPDADTGCP